MVHPVADTLGFIANIMSNIAFVPQIIKCYRTKLVRDISIGMFLTLFTTQLCWIGYAIPLHATNLWISSGIEIVLLLPIFALWIKYRHNRPTYSQQLKNEDKMVLLEVDA